MVTQHNKRVRQEAALIRRKKELKGWQATTNTKGKDGQEYIDKKIKIATGDISNLEGKLVGT